MSLVPKDLYGMQCSCRWYDCVETRKVIWALQFSCHTLLSTWKKAQCLKNFGDFSSPSEEYSLNCPVVSDLNSHTTKTCCIGRNKTFFLHTVFTRSALCIRIAMVPPRNLFWKICVYLNFGDGYTETFINKLLSSMICGVFCQCMASKISF